MAQHKFIGKTWIVYNVFKTNDSIRKQEKAQCVAECVCVCGEQVLFT